MFIAGGEKSESLEELLKEAGEEAELVLENGFASSLAKKKDGQFDDGGDQRWQCIDDEAGVRALECVLFLCCLWSGCDTLILLR